MTPANASPVAAAPNQPETKTIFDEADRILVATPCYGGQSNFEHMNAVFAAHNELAIQVRNADGTVESKPLIARRDYLSNESHIDRARNKLANMFWRSPWNWLLFIDADIVFPPAAVAELWVHGMNGHKIVCAPYAMKGIVPQFPVNAIPGAAKQADGLVEVHDAGTGFMLIHRSVFATLLKEGRADEYLLGSNDPNAKAHRTNFAFFKSGVRPVKAPNGKTVKLWLSEDYMLCYEWKKCGGRVMLDTRFDLDHIGAIKFPLNPAEVAAAYAELVRIKHPGVVAAEPKVA